MFHGVYWREVCKVILLCAPLAISAPAAIAQETEIEKQTAAVAAIYAQDPAALRRSLDPTLFAPDIRPPLLTIAAEVGNAMAIAILVGGGANIDQVNPETGLTALMAAARLGNTEMAQALLALGARTDIEGPEGQTYQSFAALSDVTAAAPQQPAAAQPLPKPKPKPTQAELDDALRAAAATANLEAIHSMLELGADVDGRDDAGRTALMYAAFSQVELRANVMYAVRQLLAAGARVAMTDDNGDTALTFGIVGGAPNAALTILIDASDLKHVNKDEVTYWEIARRADRVDVLSMLPPDPEAAQRRIAALPPIQTFLKSGNAKPDWIDIQTTLRRFGLYAADIDGLPGPKTHRGMLAYMEVVRLKYAEAGDLETAVGIDAARSRLQAEVAARQARDRTAALARAKATETAKAESRRGGGVTSRSEPDRQASNARRAQEPPKKPKRTYHKIYYRNNCNRTINTAITSWSIEEKTWVTRGYWRLEPGQKAYVAKTNDDRIYTYAISSDRRKVWKGQDVRRRIRGDGPFGFTQHKLGGNKNFRDFTHSFSC